MCVGSKFTSNATAMKGLLPLLKARNLYFIDSRTTADSVAFDTAQSLKVPSASRDVFLDNEADEAYIRGQFRELIALARKRGSAIGICHSRPETAAVLAKVIPEFKKAGIRFVSASELAQ